MDRVAQRLQQALEMWEDGVQLMRENLRRRASDASDAEIEARLAAWLAEPDDAGPDFVVRTGPPR